MKVGEVRESKNYGIYEIIEKLPKGKYRIKFIDTGYITCTQSSKLKSGSIKDHFKPVKFGVGYLGEMSGKTNKDGKPTKSYQTWHNMLVRCYDSNYHKLFPTYKQCTVCNEWKNFTNFSEWFEDNYQEGLVLDKDSKVAGNKIYSPETCTFISSLENGRLAKKDIMRKWLVEHSNGQKVKINNVSQFCKSKSFSQGTFALMLSGKRNIAWGWKLVKELTEEEFNNEVL